MTDNSTISSLDYADFGKLQHRVNIESQGTYVLQWSFTK
jgi:hypothetical protein